MQTSYDIHILPHRQLYYNNSLSRGHPKNIHTNDNVQLYCNNSLSSSREHPAFHIVIDVQLYYNNSLSSSCEHSAIHTVLDDQLYYNNLLSSCEHPTIFAYHHIVNVTTIILCHYHANIT